MSRAISSNRSTLSGLIGMIAIERTLAAIAAELQLTITRRGALDESVVMPDRRARQALLEDPRQPLPPLAVARREVVVRGVPGAVSQVPARILDRPVKPRRVPAVLLARLILRLRAKLDDLPR